MSKRLSGSMLAVLGLLASLLVLTPPTTAVANTPYVYYQGWAGGSQVTALGSTIRSDLTGRSDISGVKLPNSDTNRISGAHAAKTLLVTGQITTWARAIKWYRGAKIRTGGRTADLSILNGLIKADVVVTNAVSIKTPTRATSRAHTKFVGLTIAGKEYPLHVKQNTEVTIPGIATVKLNGKQTTRFNGQVATFGFGLYVTLLKPYGKAPAGATILLNPSGAAAGHSRSPATPWLGGQAYGTYAFANADPTVSAEVSRTAAMIMPLLGTRGDVLHNTTVDVDVPGVLTVGAVNSKEAGYTKPGLGWARMTNNIADVNAFNGLITADALTAHARARLEGAGKVRKRAWLKVVNLTIAGKLIPVDVSRNTVITVANLGKVTINKRVRTPNSIEVVGVEVVLSKERGGLPIGAVVQLAVAKVWIFRAPI